MTITSDSDHPRVTMADIPVGTEVWLVRNGVSIDPQTLPRWLEMVLSGTALAVGMMRARKAGFHRCRWWELEQVRLGNLPLPVWMLEEARAHEAADKAGAMSNTDREQFLAASRDMAVRHVEWLDQALAVRFPERDDAPPAQRAEIAARVARRVAAGESDGEPDISGLPDVEVGTAPGGNPE